jgi:hypothetical protein
MDGPEDDDQAPVIPERARDDSDEGWSEREQDDRDEQLRRERPPHWD